MGAAKRLIAFDIAKAICIVLVVVGHYIPDSSPLWYVEMRNIIYSFHMPLFMYASGYIYNATKRDEAYGSFLWKKVRRLMIPYLVTSFIIITLKLLAQGNAYLENPVTPMTYLEIFWSPAAGYFLWFIWALWWMFVIAPLFKSKSNRIVLLVIGAFLHFVPFDVPPVFGLVEAKRMLVFFALGMVCSDWMGQNIFERHRYMGILSYCTLYAIGNIITIGGVK